VELYKERTESAPAGADQLLQDRRDAGSGVPDHWRAEAGAPDLSEADLRAANLSDANLSGADLNGANLYAADLSRSCAALTSRSTQRLFTEASVR
jgi:hypothetical protein